MGSVVLSSEKIKTNTRRKPVGAMKSGIAAALLWLINLLVIFFGWPFLLYGKLKYRRSSQYD